MTVATTQISSQIAPFREKGKWGARENGNVIVKPVFDTIFGYDSTGKVCLACFKTRTASANKFMKLVTTTYYCNYLDRAGNRLIVRNSNGDTSSVFSYGKHTLKQYLGGSPYFVVSVKGKKNLVRKDFRQITFNGYHEITTSGDPSLYITQFVNEGDIVLTGLIDKDERLLIPYQYSGITLNTQDSLIVACSAGVRNNASDDIFNYEGKKITSTTRHIDNATKDFIIHKLYEPKEHYTIVNLKSGEEKQFSADDIIVQSRSEILIRIKNDWFIYDMNTHLKKPKNKN